MCGGTSLEHYHAIVYELGGSSALFAFAWVKTPRQYHADLRRDAYAYAVGAIELG